MAKRNVILASTSPRRKELLTDMGVQFSTVASNFEEMLDESRAVTDVAMDLALGKALAVAEKFPEAIVIGSDTIVTIEGKQLEKPRDDEDAYEILKMLGGKQNNIVTGVAVVIKSQGFIAKDYDIATAYFKPFDSTAAWSYIHTGDPMDKAGAYGIQSGAAPLIEKFKGNYDTAIGLPTIKLSKILQSLGVDAQPVKLIPPNF